MLDSDTKQWISIEIINTLYKRFEKFPEDSSDMRNAPFHEAFLNAFSNKLNRKVNDIPYFISLSSWLHGLNTTLGQSFFERTAHHLTSGEKKSVDHPEYKAHLMRWFLYFELDLMEKYGKIESPISGKLSRLYNQEIFENGKYKSERYVKFFKQLSG